MLILIFAITNDVLTKITDIKDPCHTWLHLQNQYEVRNTTQRLHLKNCFSLFKIYDDIGIEGYI
jgi:hypothetical protein